MFLLAQDHLTCAHLQPCLWIPETGMEVSLMKPSESDELKRGHFPISKGMKRNRGWWLLVSQNLFYHKDEN